MVLPLEVVGLDPEVIVVETEGVDAAAEVVADEELPRAMKRNGSQSPSLDV